MSRALGDHFVKNSNLGLIGEPFVSESILLDQKNCFLVVASDGVCFSFLKIVIIVAMGCDDSGTSERNLQ